MLSLHLRIIYYYSFKDFITPFHHNLFTALTKLKYVLAFMLWLFLASYFHMPLMHILEILLNVNLC